MRFFLQLLVGIGLAGTVGAAPAVDPAASAKALAGLAGWLATAREARPAVAEAAFAKVPLTKEAAARAGQLLWEDHAAFLRTTRAAELAAKAIRIGEHELKFEIVPFGDKAAAPAGGRSLFLSLHGGGGAPTEVNDSQWRNQIQLAVTLAGAAGSSGERGSRLASGARPRMFGLFVRPALSSRSGRMRRRPWASRPSSSMRAGSKAGEMKRKRPLTSAASPVSLQRGSAISAPWRIASSAFQPAASLDFSGS